MQGKPRMRAVVAALAIAGSMAIAGPAAAAAAPMTTPEGGTTAASDDIGVLSARGCTGRNGPADINASCVSVTGTGTLVQKIQGAMESTNIPPWPETLCNVKVHVWGTYKNGAPFDRTATAGCSYVGNAYVNWSPFAHFAPNSKICARTYFDGQWSNAACITVRG